MAKKGTKNDSVVVLDPKNKVDQNKNTEIIALIKRCISNVRPEMENNPYIDEALRVLPVEGYRSAIGNFWNAVIDDLRNKVMHRSLDMFNSVTSLKVKNYDDFQNLVSDDKLIEGSYKIGVIGWEASKVLKHAKETRHIFDGHPKSSTPSIYKVLAMMDDCIKYVLREEYPPEIINIDEYLTNLGGPDFDRNKVAIEIALGDLPEVYKNELANRLFSAYIDQHAPSDLRSNIELVITILWRVLPKQVKIQIVRRVDQIIAKGNAQSTDMAFAFISKVNAKGYLSVSARKYYVEPILKKWTENITNWKIENDSATELKSMAAFIPEEYRAEFVCTITRTYVGHVGASHYFSRTDFYANVAALIIPEMFELFDDASIEEFIECIKNNARLRQIIKTPVKLARLRSLGNIALERYSENYGGKEFLGALVDESRESDFFKMLPKIRR